MAKRTKWADWNEWLDENYSTMTTREISERIGCTMEAVKQQAFKRKLVKFPDDISFFENWTPESAYIIGLWAADGYANVRPGKGVALSISQSDKDGILQRIQEIVGRGSVYYIPQHDSERWELYSRHFYEFLSKAFGHDVRAKSRTMQWPNVPTDLERDFIRGFCDGDGHVGVSKQGQTMIRFYCGSVAFRDTLMRKIEKWTGIEGTTSIAINTVHLAIYTSIKSICLAHWLYQAGDLAKPRKVEAAQKIMSDDQDRIQKTSITPKMREMFPDILSRFSRETNVYLMADEIPTCSVEGCNRIHRSRGYCDMHYQRWKKWGDVAERVRQC